ncbi:leucine-rich repeat-containing protein 34 isoform X3 [Choloepus didactylus]|uniref:leucine-rich repeat-containing protein 34 isoform X3 n=1 Tax=Choloepus didactylus TaxID=27675 RepID=UPI00189FA739|nr:leucine-rich repeat-containing protein 34 isoform X3 [Choloepus didactylus]
MDPSPAPGPTRVPTPTPTPTLASAEEHVPASIASLREHYCNLCAEKSQKINPFILNILQEVDEECKKGLEKGIILNIAGNNRLMPVQRVTGEDFWTLSRILKKNPYIIGLDVRYNLLSHVGAYYAAKLLEKQLNIIYLNLMFNDIGPDGGELIAKVLHGMQSVIAFATVLTQNKAIRGINLNRPILYGEQEESTVHIGHMLKENHCLVELHVCKHDIKNYGIKQLCDALYLNTSLRYLDVSCNKITRDGMVYLADVLKSNTTLEIIDLSFNRIENAGASYLSESLTSHNRTLKVLSVVSNNIEGEGLVALSQSMKTNPTLTNIYVWGNKFDEATCMAYSDLIQMGRLQPDNTDVEPFVVDDHVYLAEVSNGLKKHYYWTPTYGEAYGHSSNAGFALVPIGHHL